MQRSKKTLSLVYLACGFLCWLFFSELLGTVWVVARLPLLAGWVIPPYEMIAVVFGIALFIFLIRNERVNEFTNDVLTELSKVVWPGRKETALSTGVVSVMVGICSLILFAFDMVWGMLVRIFYQ